MNKYVIRKILVPIDLSETSLSALRTATDIAARSGAQLVLFHVRDNSLDFLGSDYQAEDHSEDIIQALASTIQFKHNIEPVTIMQEGAVAPAILRELFHDSYDLVVMGSHGASGYRESFIGSNTYQVIKFAGCPVLTVQQQRRPVSFNRVLFPVRMVSGALMRYDVVRPLLTPEASSVQVLGLLNPRQDREAGLREEITREALERMHEDNVRSKTFWKDSYAISDDVLIHAQQESSDLIVVTAALDVTHKPFFVGPNVQKIISHSRVPVLSIRKQRVPSLS